MTFVHYSGECVSTQTGEKVIVGIYFKLNDDSSFEIDRMTWNGETMNLLKQNEVLSEIGDSYCKDHGIASSNALEGSLDELENALSDALAIHLPASAWQNLRAKPTQRIRIPTILPRRLPDQTVKLLARMEWIPIRNFLARSLWT